MTERRETDQSFADGERIAKYLASAGVASRRDVSDPARGFSGLARVPLDLTFNLGFRMDTKAGGFVFAFANALGFIPAFRGNP